jgi:hypothetical protein
MPAAYNPVVMPSRAVLSSLLGLAVMCGASTGCSAQTTSQQSTPTASGSSARAAQVLITFAPNTSSERIEKVTQELGVRVDQKMFGRIVVGSAGGSRTIGEVQDAARKYPDVVAVEPSSTVRAQ